MRHECGLTARGNQMTLDMAGPVQPRHVAGLEQQQPLAARNLGTRLPAFSDWRDDEGSPRGIRKLLDGRARLGRDNHRMAKKAFGYSWNQGRHRGGNCFR